MLRWHGLKFWITAIPVSVTIVVIFLFFQRPSEPTYKGLTMSQWVWSRETREKQEALIILGANNIPRLVEGLKYDMTKDRRFALYRRLPDRLQKIKWVRDLGRKNMNEEDVAVDVMRRLEHLAAPAVLEFSDLARTGSLDVVQRIMPVLANVGQEGLFGILAGMHNTNQYVRREAFACLDLYENFPAAWTVITNAINDPDPEIRRRAATWVARGHLHGN